MAVKEEQRSNESYVITAEYELLKCLIDFPDAPFPDLTENSFPHKAARSIYQAIDILRRNGEVISEMPLLRESNKIDSSVDVTTVSRIMSLSVDRSNIPGALSALQSGTIKYHLDIHAAKLKALLDSSNTLSAVEVYKITSDMQEVIATLGKKVSSKTMEEALENYDTFLDERKEGNRFLLGDDFLNKSLTRKFRGGQTITLAGATGAGKSAFALKLVKDNINLSIPTMYYTLEMDEESTMDRFIAQSLNMPIDALYDPSNIEYVRNKKRELLAQYKGRAFRLIDDPSIDLATIHYQIREFKSIYKVDYICVVIDLATMVKDFVDVKGGGAGTLANTIEMAVNMLNAIAKVENVCFIDVVQFGRSADSTRIESLEELDKLRPTLNSIKNSHALAERSRVVLSVFRPKYYAERLFPENPELEFMVDEMQIQILKQSQGAVGSIGRYIFDGPTFNIEPRKMEMDASETSAEPGTEHMQF